MECILFGCTISNLSCKREKGIEFEFLNVPSYVRNSNFVNPLKPTKGNIRKYNNCLDKIWLFENSDNVHSIVEVLLSCVRKSILVEKGIIDACTWGLNEVMTHKFLKGLSIGTKVRGFIL